MIIDFLIPYMLLGLKISLYLFLYSFGALVVLFMFYWVALFTKPLWYPLWYIGRSVYRKYQQKKLGREIDKTGEGSFIHAEHVMVGSRPMGNTTHFEIEWRRIPMAKQIRNVFKSLFD